MANNGKSTVLSFEQPSEFFGKRAQKLMDQADLWGALSNLRRALDIEPDNAGYKMDIAEILAQMGLYERSCQVLFSMIVSGDEENMPECFFALGCNFYALRMNDLSRECLMSYLQMDRDGEFRQDCEDMIAMLREEYESGEDYLYPAAERSADDGKYALDTGDYAKAQQLLTQALQQDPSMLYARNNLALAYYFAGDTKNAIREGEKVLKTDPDDPHGLCNMALFLNSRGQYERAAELVRRAQPTEQDEGEELYKICLTMAELGMDQDVLNQTGDLIKYSPFDERALFLHAVAGCNLGMPAAVYRDVTRLLLIDPDNEMFRYLHRQVAARMQEIQGKNHRPIVYTAPIPYRQIVKKIMRAQEFLRMGQGKEAAEAWETDESLRRDLLWCLYYGEDNSLRMALCHFLADLHRPSATQILKEMLVSLHLSDEIKKNVVVTLCCAGEEPPYLAVIDAHLAKVNVRREQDALKNRKMPRAYERVLRRVLESLVRAHEPERMNRCVEIWLNHIAALPDPLPHLNNEDSWTAALELALRDEEIGPEVLFVYANRAHTFPHLLSRRIQELREHDRQAAPEDDPDKEDRT